MALILSITTQYGNFWKNILGQYRSLIFDPGGWYLTSGVYFFRNRTPYFWGHPGLVLQLIIGVFLEGFYFILHLWNDIPYELFFVKNYPLIISGMSMIMSLIQVFVFYLVYKISQKILKHPTCAMIAVIAYMTTTPVYFYINRISPDVIGTLFILLCIHFLLLGTGISATGRSAARNIALAGFAITTSIFSKAAFGLPVYMAVGIFLLFINYPVVANKSISRRRVILIFGIVSIITAAIWSIKLDYYEFYSYWTSIADARVSADFWSSIEILFEHPNNLDIFLLSEFTFLLISMFGFVSMVSAESKENKHSYYLLFLIFLASIPMALIKLGAPQYLFVLCATGSIAFSYQIKRMFARNLLPSLSEKQKSLIGLSIILVIHFPGIYMVSTSHLQAFHAFRQTSRPIFAALQDIDYDEKIAVNEETHAFRKYYLAITKNSPQAIKDAVDRIFIYSESINDIPQDQDVKYFIDIKGSQTTSLRVE